MNYYSPVFVSTPFTGRFVIIRPFLRKSHCRITMSSQSSDASSRSMQSLARLRSLQEAILRRRNKLSDASISSQPISSNPNQSLPLNNTNSITRPSKASSPQITMPPISNEAPDGAPSPSRPCNEIPPEPAIAQYETLRKRDGRLPWRNAVTITDSAATYHSVQLLPLSAFTRDSNPSRSDWYLPRFQSSNLMGSVDSASGNIIEDSTILKDLNEQQRQAVLASHDKACLVLAGPGSGKTRVLTHRVAYLVDKLGVPPHRILAVTFTNKAAGELKERLTLLLNTNSKENTAPFQKSTLTSRLAVGTFHSIAAQFLRQYGDTIGIPPDFLISDTADSRQVVSTILKKVEGKTPDSASIGMLRAQISKLKNESGDQLRNSMSNGLFMRLHELRKQYDRELRSMNHLDFDDLLVETRRLFQSVPHVLAEVQNLYQHVLVDEWQDTNVVQFDIVSLISAKRKNLFVVGDADQSIYKFRGADVRNLESFSQVFADAKTITLGHNYRSTACIVAAAQSVIEGNQNRPLKKMTTPNSFGHRVKLNEIEDDRKEAFFVSSASKKLVFDSQVGSFSDIGIMYRTNAQSRLLEEACIISNVPYQLLSGTKFYERMEVKDLISYLRLLSNPTDNNSFRRVINIPPRGIGKKTLEAVEELASSRNIPLLSALDYIMETFLSDQDGDAGKLGLRKASLKKLADFHGMLSILRKAAEPFRDTSRMSSHSGSNDTNVNKLLAEIVCATGYREYIKSRGSEGGGTETMEKSMERINNIDELERAASRYDSLPAYLQSVSLMTETEDDSEAGENRMKKDSVSLLTLHSAKGLEFPAVFITGVEDGLIPLGRTLNSGDEEELEEERRLLYVGMTRAKSYLTMTWRAQKVTIHSGNAWKQSSRGPSRFLEAVPSKFLHRKAIDKPSGKSKSKVTSTSYKRNRRANFGVNRGSDDTPMARDWKVGDAVRCEKRGRGTVIKGLQASTGGGWIEVMFLNGSKEFVNTAEEQVELLFGSP